jgi:hypothetical protein
VAIANTFFFTEVSGGSSRVHLSSTALSSLQ